STLREVKSARDSIREKEDEVLNYFINRSTNAAAESLNSKIKHFRSQLHGVSDLPFFIYRLTVNLRLALPRNYAAAPLFPTSFTNRADIYSLPMRTAKRHNYCRKFVKLL
ncbi:MAG: transposase, partial [Muribaculaceae bacterium]|nr:transposase [Muribaculaceae bacterium]